MQPGRAEVDTQKGQPWRDAARSGAGDGVQGTGNGATLFRFRDSRGFDMHKHFSKADIERAKVELLPELLQPADKGKGRNHYVCPFCGRGDVYNPWWSRGAFHCLSCNRGGSVFDVVAFREGLSIGDAIQEVMERRGAEAQDYCAKLRPRDTATRAAGVDRGESKRDVLQWRLTCRGYCLEAAARFRGSAGQEYAEGRRGFTLDTCQRFGVGFDAEAFCKDKGTGGKLAVGVPALVVPYGPRRDYYGGRLLRALGKTKFMKPGVDVAGPEPCYNAGALWAADVVLICEGWADVLTVYQAGQAAKLDGLTVGAVALNGTGPRALIGALRRKPTRAALVIALDDDKAGRRGAVHVGREQESIGAAAGIWCGGYAVDGCKDFNELLQREPGTAAALVGEMGRDTAQGRLFTAAEAAEMWADDLQAAAR